MNASRSIALGLALSCLAPLVGAQEDVGAPLSAIDWLSESVEQPAVAVAPPRAGTQATRIPDANEDPVANSAAPPSVTVQPLGGGAPRVLGILPPSVTGLPADLWENSDASTLAALLQAEQVDTLPALQDLLITLTLSEANPPRGPDAEAFFLARVDKLLSFGALEQAQALLEAATPDTPALYRRWFDVSLLTGTEDSACRSLRDKPDVAPTPAARIFCLARSGDWSAAALTLNTGLALGDIDDDTGGLLSRFLDPDLYEGEPALTPPAVATPLTFRMFEAIGTPLSTQGLPRAFSHADLRPNVGWKAQLEAAERLARSGAISSNVLVGLYTARVPAASGGVWERATAVIALETALDAEQPDVIADAARTLWDEALPRGVIVPLAEHFAPALMLADVDPRGADIVFKLLLLSDQYEAAALIPTLAGTDPFLAAVARGDPSDAAGTRPAVRVIRGAFAGEPDPVLVDMAADNRAGEAILRTIATVQQGLDGDPVALQTGLATLRALGLEDIARRTALQYALLP